MQTMTGRLPAGTTGPAPAITCALPTHNPNGAALIIFPGGGYAMLADHEGQGYADFLTRHGIACFVVRYRLGSDGHRHPAMLEDALAAIATVREAAGDLGLNPHAIGVMGSSAGGHLAAHAMVAWKRYANPVSIRPDFGILCYPVIRASGPVHHAGSFANLLGPDPAPELLQSVSCDQLVTPDTPPCFIWHTGEDPSVPLENSLAFAAALRQHAVPFELHIYAKGGHGLGLNTPFDWGRDCVRWIGETVRGAAIQEPQT